MDRLEFSKLIQTARENQTIGKNEMCRLLGCPFHHLQRIEGGLHNYNMKKALNYIDAMNCCLYINDLAIVGYSFLISSLVSKRHLRHYSQRQLASLINCTNSMIGTMEKEKTLLTVDLFTKIANCLECEITIKKK